MAWLDQHPHETMRRYIDRYELDDRELYLLDRGSLVSLAPGAGTWIDELFELFAAVILRGLAWILEDGAAETPRGLQPYPAHREREIAALCLASRS